MKKAVIFDLDGTLLDTLSSIEYCSNKALAAAGYAPREREEYKYFVGDGAKTLIKRALAAAGDPEGRDFDKAFAAYGEVFRDYCMYEVKPYAGIRELLEALAQKGVKTAVLSNKQDAETKRVVASFFGEGAFSQVRGQVEGMPVKPHPAGALRILELWGLEGRDVIYLGDTGTDMATGKAIRALTLGALWGFRKAEELQEGGADALLKKPMELLTYLEK